MLVCLVVSGAYIAFRGFRAASEAGVSMSLIFRIRRMAAVAPRLELRILLIFPWKSLNSSSRMTRYMGYLNKIYRTVIAPLLYTQRLLYTPRTLLLNKKFKNPIFPVRNYISNALCAFVLPIYKYRFPSIGSGINLYNSLLFESFYYFFFYSSSALSLIINFLVLDLI
jgi:hypothetical protein